MINLHCHKILGIDNRAKDLEHSLAKAKIAVTYGITQVLIHRIIKNEVR